jgi:hypothetical protein
MSRALTFSLNLDDFHNSNIAENLVSANRVPVVDLTPIVALAEGKAVGLVYPANVPSTCDVSTTKYIIVSETEASRMFI